VDDWTRLHRFLILGSEGGSYYATERTLTAQNANAIMRCIDADGVRVVETIVAVSEAGRAPKNDPAIFALALVTAQGDVAARRAAFAALPRVCRMGTHLFHFAQYVEQCRGWGRGLRQAIAAWYTGLSARDLAYQAVKYRQRDGWSHRDLLRLAHPTPATEQHAALFHWMTQGWPGVGDEPHPDAVLRLIWAFERAQRATDADEIVRLIRDERLPREAVPTEWLTHATVWDALLDEMPMTAMIRNLATMTRVGLLDATSDATAKVIAELGNATRLRAARVHPIAVLAALLTYRSGRGVRGGATWTPVTRVVDALDAAFYTAFSNVEPTGKQWLLALDVSGSMGGGMVAGVPGLTPRIASAAMALVTAATEAQHQFVSFQTTLTPLTISPRQRLDDVVRSVSGLPFGGTDCGLPMLWALEHKVPVDVFAIYTDSETWAGAVHPAEALRRYRAELGIPAKLIVVGMVSNGFSIADPEDAGMLDVVGFDTTTPQLLADFAMDAV
jgi:60 kDa SS-A/Ro ribonucleoprotein